MNLSLLSQEKVLSPKRNASSFLGSVSPSQRSPTSLQKPLEVGTELSASTLQHSVLTCKFPKAERFPTINQNLHSQSSIILPSTLNHKGTSLGYGKKVMMSELVLNSGWDVPGPNHYTPTMLESSNKGKSFGISYAAYQKVYSPHCSTILPEIAREYPGPGQYHNPEEFGIGGKKASLKARGRMFNEVVGQRAPPSNYYKPNHSYVEPARYKGASFGIGERSEFTKDGNQSPGPGSYKIASKFDTYSQRRVVEERLKERLKAMKLNSS